MTTISAAQFRQTNKPIKLKKLASFQTGRGSRNSLKWVLFARGRAAFARDANTASHVTPVPLAAGKYVRRSSST
jgi:hypothetical protein